ncbi:MAG: hypothetical protein GF383_10320 [Candidatus Lokiarchaeota archaeon]|nr:hypothetical protein [Candidatus Lokiarchaeota archaeon]MBD3340951.1 hypothetical protein [Candidatus Lokiarchaeota archaeon]
MEPFEIFNGFSQVVFVAIVWIVGIKIASKYIKLEERNLLFVGMVWIGLSEPWFATVVAFLLAFFLGISTSVEIFLIIGFAFTPITMFLWIFVITDFIYKEKQKIILILVMIFGVLFETIFFYFVIVQPSVLAEMISPWRIVFKLPIQLWIITLLVIFAVTSAFFCRDSLRSDNPKIRLKGRFLLLAFITYIIGGILEAFYTPFIFMIIIKRLITIIASIEFYFGFILPERVEKFFLKTK